MAVRPARLLVTLGFALGAVLRSPSAEAAVRLPTSQETNTSVVLGRGADLGETVAAGSEVTVTAAVRAPAVAGTYPFQWQLGRRVNDAPAVVFGAATAPRQMQVGTRYAAACEGDLCTHTLALPAGQTATVEVALRNSGLVAWEAGAVALVAQGGGGTPARQEATAEQGEVVTLPVTVTAGSGDGEVTWRLEGPAASAGCDGAETRGAFGPTVVVRVQVPVAPVDVDGGPRVLAYYHHDAIGSVRAVTDADGDVVRRYEYEPFGRMWDGPAQAPERRMFTGQEHDAATGLDYFGARYLRADIGRFTTIDPVTTIDENLVDPQRWNRYAYVRNNPLKFVDPDGRMPVIVIPLLWEAGTALVAVTSVYLTTPQGQQQVRAVGEEFGRLVSVAAEGLRTWYESRADGQHESGGGKTGRKANPDRSASATDKYEEARKAHAEADRKPNKTPEDRREVERLRRERDHWKRKADEKSEEHARKAQGGAK